MIIDVSGTIHRLFFEHEEVPLEQRYKGKREAIREIRNVIATLEAKRVQSPRDLREIEALRNVVTTSRTLCRLERLVGYDKDNKRVWAPVAEGRVHLNYQDAPSKSKAVKFAFQKMLTNLREADTGEYDGVARARIAAQFLATRPRKPSYKELKRKVAQLEARIAELEVEAPALSHDLALASGQY